MKYTTLGLAALVVAGSISTGAFAQSDTDNDLVKRGEYVARAADCAACHTDPKGGQPYAGGYSIPFPMGQIIATNITPSKKFGIGGWTEEQFERAVREGVAPGGKRLYPAMPYPSYAHMKDGDVKALYAYLMHKVAPVDQPPAKTTKLQFPFNIRLSLLGWDVLFAPSTGWKAPEGLSAQEERGAYLVKSLEHCGTCHTPRALLMNSDNSKFLGGGSLGSWRAPNITPDKETGIGTWSVDDIVSYLKNGFSAGHGSAAGPMAEAVDHSLSHLRDEDLKSIAAYLKTVPAVHSPIDAKTDAKAKAVPVTSYEKDDWKGNPDNAAALAKHDTTDGAVLYNSACAACHGVDGQGSPDGHFPNLSKSSPVTSKDPSNLVMTIVDGISRHDARGYTVMPAFANDLNNGQVASLAHYVSANFGGRDEKITADDVATIRSGGVTPWIVRNSAWLVIAGNVVGALVIIAVLAFLVFFMRSRRKQSNA